mmetsp:Transcript_58003/g.184254  ORF Transcript_58003/g.184254 Transcript_58003/m.184254 type:complete len:301 (-) Transcript_58003:1208-2110(-)
MAVVHRRHVLRRPARLALQDRDRPRGRVRLFAPVELAPDLVRLLEAGVHMRVGLAELHEVVEAEDQQVGRGHRQDVLRPLGHVLPRNGEVCEQRRLPEVVVPGEPLEQGLLVQVEHPELPLDDDEHAATLLPALVHERLGGRRVRDQARAHVRDEHLVQVALQELHLLRDPLVHVQQDPGPQLERHLPQELLGVVNAHDAALLAVVGQDAVAEVLRQGRQVLEEDGDDVELVVVGLLPRRHLLHHLGDVADDQREHKPPDDHADDREHALRLVGRGDVTVAHRRHGRERPVHARDVPLRD